MNPDESVLRRLEEIPRVTSLTGVFVSMVGGLARVNLQGSTVDVKCDWKPAISGQPVRVESLNGILRVTGPAGARSAVGEVTASVAGGTRATVVVDGKEWTLPVMAPYVPIPTDDVVISWDSGFILGEQAAAPDGGTTPPVGGGGTPFTDLLVQSTNSGRFNTGGAAFGDSNVWTGSSTRGAWFYAGGFAALAGAAVSRAEIYLPLIKQQNNMSFGLHSSPNKPGTDPGAAFVTAHGGGRSGWVDLPAVWGNMLRDNPSWGISVLSPGGGNNQWAGRGVDSMSGAIRFAGTR